jgi:hypothetical protein
MTAKKSVLAIYPYARAEEYNAGYLIAEKSMIYLSYLRTTEKQAWQSAWEGIQIMMLKKLES